MNQKQYLKDLRLQYDELIKEHKKHVRGSSMRMTLENKIDALEKQMARLEREILQSEGQGDLFEA